MPWTESDRVVLRTYPRPLAHMWRQVESGRFGLVIGAGVNVPLGFPNWSDLVARIADHPDVQAETLRREFDKTPVPILTQILLHHYHKRRLDLGPLQDARTDKDQARLIAAGFRDIMHECLYRDVPANDEELATRDKFYKHFIAVVRKSPMTVVYNFDDTLERLLLMTRPAEGRSKGSRGFEVVTDGRQQFRQPRGVIYHPNGYLPYNLIEGRSDRVIFTEESLEDQLIGSIAGEYSTLLHHLSKNTCLFVGLSLDDASLRHILRQSAKMNPGNYHYLVHYVEPMPHVLTDDERARVAANFEVFNLITLFLDSPGIASVGTLLGSDARALRGFAEEEGVNLSYCFYLTGVPGVGKTTTYSFFKNLVTFDEWLDERLPEMGRPWTELTEEEQERVDQFVLQQWNLKNLALLNDVRETGVGALLVDRCLPDALAFTPYEDWSGKAGTLLDAVSPGQARREVQPGHIILLLGDEPELVVRARCSGKDSEITYVTTLQVDTETIYSGPGITPLNVRGMTIAEVVRSVARIVHNQEYVACDIRGLLERYRKEGHPPGAG